jgi:hypothetical protein
MTWVPSIRTRRIIYKNGKRVTLGRWHCECGWIGFTGVRDDNNLAKKLHEDNCQKEDKGCECSE